jgi:ketosteroid isomerase-like protein
MDVTDNTQLVLAFFAALSRGDIAGAQALLADNTTWWMPGTLPTSGVYKQREAILEECQDYASIEVRHAVGKGITWQSNGSPVAIAPKDHGTGITTI